MGARQRGTHRQLARPRRLSPERWSRGRELAPALRAVTWQQTTGRLAARRAGRLSSLPGRQSPGCSAGDGELEHSSLQKFPALKPISFFFLNMSYQLRQQHRRGCSGVTHARPRQRFPLHLKRAYGGGKREVSVRFPSPLPAFADIIRHCDGIRHAEFKR